MEVPLALLVFLPTPSARRATVGQGVDLDDPVVISTHALREEGDRTLLQQRHQTPSISTHALREEGDVGHAVTAPHHAPISTHALREEGDSKCAGK